MPEAVMPEAVMDGSPRMGGPGDNAPPTDIEIEVTKLMERAQALPVGDLDAASVIPARAIIEAEVALRQRMDRERENAVRPHLDAQRQINGYWSRLIESGRTAAAIAKEKVAKYLAAEEARRRAAAAAAAEAAYAAEERAVEADNPFDIYDRTKEANSALALARDTAKIAEGKAQVRGGGARALSLKTTHVVRVVDPEALVLHYAKHADVIAAATKLAQAQVRAAKGDPAGIAGIVVDVERGL